MESGALSQLRDAGTTDSEIVDVWAPVGLNIFTNYFNRVADTEIDFPFVTATANQSAA